MNRFKHKLYTMLANVFNYLNRNDKKWIMYLFWLIVLVFQVITYTQTKSLYNSCYQKSASQPVILKSDFQKTDKH